MREIDSMEAIFAIMLGMEMTDKEPFHIHGENADRYEVIYEYILFRQLEQVGNYGIKNIINYAIKPTKDPVKTGSFSLFCDDENRINLYHNCRHIITVVTRDVSVLAK